MLRIIPKPHTRRMYLRPPLLPHLIPLTQHLLRLLLHIHRHLPLHRITLNPSPLRLLNLLPQLLIPLHIRLNGIEPRLGDTRQSSPVELLREELLRRFVDTGPDRLELLFFLDVVQEAGTRFLEVFWAREGLAPDDGVRVLWDVSHGGSGLLTIDDKKSDHGDERQA